MLYTNIVKLEKGFRIGYSLINKKENLVLSTPDGALIIRNKVRELGYQKGFIPHEISFEQICTGMVKYDLCYAFDQHCLNKFLTKFKEEMGNLYDRFKELEEKSFNNKLAVLGFDGFLVEFNIPIQ